MLVVEPAGDEDMLGVMRLAGDALQTDPSTWQLHRPCCMIAKDVATGRLAGFALADRDACEGHLLALAVDGGQRGLGIGGRLLERVRYQMQREGALRMHLDVRAHDVVTQDFYRRHGFHAEGLQQRAYPDGEDAVHFARPL
ncbi:MAG: GNAT family N-acetyltransferase [Thermoplasmatota archaeon]